MCEKVNERSKWNFADAKLGLTIRWNSQEILQYKLLQSAQGTDSDHYCQKLRSKH